VLPLKLKRFPVMIRKRLTAESLSRCIRGLAFFYFLDNQYDKGKSQRNGGDEPKDFFHIRFLSELHVLIFPDFYLYMLTYNKRRSSLKSFVYFVKLLLIFISFG